MTIRSRLPGWGRAVLLALLGGLASAGLPALAQPAAPTAAPAKKAAGSASILPGANSKEPVNINAAKLDYFDKEQKLIYSGEVVARQGDSTLRATVLTIFLSKDKKKDEPAAATPAEAKTAGNSVSRMEATGPVTIVSKDQVGTGDNGVYDKTENKITLTGNVTLSQATNVIKGDRLVYDMTSGQAHVSSEQSNHRVISVFTPGSSAPGGAASPKKPKRGAASPAAKAEAKPLPSQ